MTSHRNMEKGELQKINFSNASLRIVKEMYPLKLKCFLLKKAIPLMKGNRRNCSQ